MAELGDLLREAVGEVAPEPWSVDDVARRARRRRHRQRVGGALATVAVVVAAAVGVMTGGDRSGVDVVDQPQPPTGQPVFSTPTGVALLFDDGYDGVTALDLDTGVVGRRVVDGQRAGDQPYRLFRSGDSLIVGWGEVFAAPLDGGPSVSLGEATLAVPAVRAGPGLAGDVGGRQRRAGRAHDASVDLQGSVEKTELVRPTAPTCGRESPAGCCSRPLTGGPPVVRRGPDTVVAATLRALRADPCTCCTPVAAR